MYSHPMLLATHPYWTDYVSAFGATVGILVAGAAFVVAFRSARDARRSASTTTRSGTSTNTFARTCRQAFTDRSAMVAVGEPYAGV